MSEYYYTPSSTSAISNEDSNRKSFQRTYSAQVNDKEGDEHCMQFKYQSNTWKVNLNS